MNPVLKYRGGKSREIPRFLSSVPEVFNRYVEPFFGGGALYFYLEPDNAIINDLNYKLMTFYRQLRDQYPLMRRQLDKIQRIYSEIVDTYNEIIADGYYDTPLMLEYNTWRAMTMLNGGDIKGNFKFDDAGQPLSTASGNMPDIECDYEDFVLAVEVTMQRGSRQYESEGEPVARHFGQLKKRTGKETYCLFIAPVVNKASLAHFFALNKMEISYYGGRTKIVPLDLEQFMKLVDNSYNYKKRPTAQELKIFLDEVILQEECSANEEEWATKIQDCVNNWLLKIK